MKSKFYLLLLIPSLLLLTSCKKWMPENRIVGNWKLAWVEKQYPFSSETVFTGYENGIFVFNNNESAQFSDSHGQMNGSWRMMQRSGGYYDNDGNWHNEPTTSLELRLYNYNSNRVIEWEFTRIDFSSNDRLIGYMDRYGYSYRYEFRRY